MSNRKHHPRTRTIVGAVAAFASVTAGLTFASPAEAATSAVFIKGLHVLTITADGNADAVTVARDADGALTVNGGAVKIHGARATVGNVAKIVVLGGAGDDRLAIDDANGPMPPADLFGGAGDDELFGGSSDDRLVGGDGNDALFGGGGDDELEGSAGNDRLVGGKGADQVFGEAGDDELVWNPGDDSDLNEGGHGSDTVEVNGGAAGETFSVAANGSRVRFDRTDPLPFTLDIGTTEQLALNANAGDDEFSTSGDLASLIALRVDGGSGNDHVVGGNGNDILVGGVGDDVVDGGQGHDTASLGEGDDTFEWNPGDGSDTVEGDGGHDALVFNGADIAENFVLSADGRRAHLVRNIGNVNMDLGGVEQVETNALGGADTFTVDDLSGTDVTESDVNLGATVKGSTGDRASDLVVVNGTAGADTLTITGDVADGVTVSGLQALVHVAGSDGPTDGLTVNGLGGVDTIESGGLADGVVALTLHAD